MNNPINCSDPSGEVALPLVTGAFGAGGGALGSIAGQLISNMGTDNFSWTSVGVASGVGFVAGAAAPYTAVTWLGAALTGGVSNIAQYGITQTVNNQDITMQDVVLNGITGIAGGLIGGAVAQPTGLTYSVNSPWYNSQLASSLNNDLSVLANVSFNAGFRGFSGATTSSIDVPGVINNVTSAISEDENAADGGFVLYPNMSNTNQIKSVYSK